MEWHMKIMEIKNYERYNSDCGNLRLESDFVNFKLFFFSKLVFWNGILKYSKEIVENYFNYLFVR